MSGVSEIEARRIGMIKSGERILAVMAPASTLAAIYTASFEAALWGSTKIEVTKDSVRVVPYRPRLP